MPEPGPRPPRALSWLFEQFEQPSGFLGRVAGGLMAQTDEDDRWAAELLDLQPDDHVLDIGCGPGVALEVMAGLVPSGSVAGVDPSELMVEESRERIAALIASGRGEVHRAEAARLPFMDARFTKACALHCVQFWPSLGDGIREAKRVLTPDGVLLLMMQLRRPVAPWFHPARYGFGEADVQHVLDCLEEQGFAVETRQRTIGRQDLVAVLALRHR